MEPIVLEMLERPKLNRPIFIEGLPGVGSVGKIAIEHLIAELKPKKFAEICSKHFPPQVMVDQSGRVKMFTNDLYYLKRSGKPDLVFMSGDTQAITPDGQYELSDFIVSMVFDLGVKEIYTLGGYNVGKLVEKARVFGAGTSDELIAKAQKLGVVFKTDEPGGGIAGASGLILAFAEKKNIPSLCLLGETGGFFVDPKGAEATLAVLVKLIDVKVNLSELEERAKQVEKITQRIHEFEESLSKPGAPSKKENLGYFG
jgi:uncharacterized protein (TIGR00162 family)